MTDDYPIISADSHFVEPPDMYAERMQPKFRDQAPRMQRFTDEAGNEYDAWSIHGEQVGDIGRFVSAGYRFDEATVAQAWVTRPLWDEVPASAYDPHELVKALDEDGVWGACIQPTQGFGWFKVEDLELLSDICHASNDWIADFCAPYPDRLKGVGVINVRDVDRAVDEFHRCAERGIAAAFVPIWPADRERYDHPMYDPVFAAANETEIPLLMHIGAYGPHITGLERVIPVNGKAPDMVAADRTVFDFYVRHSLACIIFSGVLDRYPKLQIGTVEHELAWIPHWLSQMDFVYRERPALRKGWTSTDGMLPSDYWRRNMFGTFMEDDFGVRMRDMIGIDNIAWGNDFPHSESTWPRSMDFIDRIFADVSAEDRRKLVCDNAARIYGFDQSRWEAPAVTTA